jgi:hypothetical protein
MPIEFLAEEPDEPAEPDAGADDGPRSQRTVVYRVAAGALVLVGVIVWALTRPTDTTPTSAAPPSTVSSPSVAHTPAVVEQGTLTCQTDAPVNIPIASAMKRYLPALDLSTLTAYRCVNGGAIDARTMYEAITGRYHHLNIDVEAALRSDGPQVNSLRLGAENGRYVLVARIEALAAGLKVDVSAWGTRGARPPIDAMRRLADFVSLNVVL